MEMDKFGLIGKNISASDSPSLFKAAYGGRYSYDLLDGEDFPALWQKFLDGYKAVNVTAPYKENAFAEVLELVRNGKGAISGPCFKIKATNLVVKTDEGLMAHNSDFSGIILSVADTYFPGLVSQCYETFGEKGHIKVHQFMRENIAGLFVQKPQALIVGCGGAGKAAAVAAAEMGFETALMNRTPEKARAIAEQLPEYGFIPVPVSDFKNSLKECDLIIYTVPETMPQVAELTADDFAGEGGPSKVILEANYKTPAFSGLVRDRMAMADCRYIEGRKWLMYQAVTGYSLMTGEKINLPAMEEVFKKS